MRSNDGEGEDVNKKEESKTMSNFIFISPNFPTNYWQFCRELKNDGMNVLGIGDQPYDELKPDLMLKSVRRAASRSSQYSLLDSSQSMRPYLKAKNATAR